MRSFSFSSKFSFAPKNRLFDLFKAFDCRPINADCIRQSGVHNSSSSRQIRTPCSLITQIFGSGWSWSGSGSKPQRRVQIRMRWSNDIRIRPQEIQPLFLFLLVINIWKRKYNFSQRISTESDLFLKGRLESDRNTLTRADPNLDQQTCLWCDVIKHQKRHYRNPNRTVIHRSIKCEGFLCG